ncbi:VWA domain-containing protein [Pontibacter sp. G13]|uniref:VWA domain-containing protein n=1 Tax=Pontibacter sp. G13 TaxID=3074898 RepID=UPI00288A9FC1|nr:VWA domain-containing protein [Pontibacter sp. G13]WNJ20263.1 FG-GAP-like repeat-containing protein [Pontibacter sp. G13]
MNARLLSLLIAYLVPVALFAQMQPDGRYFYDHDMLDNLTPGLVDSLMLEQQSGKGVLNIGDLNGDGQEDLVLGTPGGTAGGLLVLMMESDSTVKQVVRLDESHPAWSGQLTPGGQFGARLESAGDWNGDGIPDLWVGEAKAKLGPLSYGAVWLVLMNADGSAKQATKLSGRTPILMKSLPRDQLFGSDIAQLEDLDGDGVPEILVGAPGIQTKSAGMVLLLWMNRDGSVKKTTPYIRDAFELMPTLKKGDQFGCAVELLGDLNQDGIGDVAIGAMGDDVSGLNRGTVYIFFLNSDGTPKSVTQIAQRQSGFAGFIENDDRLGNALACLGDLNDDDIPDLAIGSFLSDNGGKDFGAIHICYLDRDGTVKGHHRISHTSKNFLGELDYKYQWGYSLSPLGDWNEDGRPDLMVSGFKQKTNGQETGGAWLLYPTGFPAHMLKKGDWVTQVGLITAEDSARIFVDAHTAADSALIDSLYDLTSFAPNNLVLLLDVSASMRHPSKLPLLRDAFIDLLKYLPPTDKISVVTYSGDAQTVLDGIPALEQEQIKEVLSELKSQGDTKPDRGLKMAYQVALNHFIPNGNNRIIMATDGGFDFHKLDKVLEKQAQPGLPLSVFYFGKQPQWKLDEMSRISGSGFGESAHITPNTVKGALQFQAKQLKRKEQPEESIGQ